MKKNASLQLAQFLHTQLGYDVVVDGDTDTAKVYSETGTYLYDLVFNWTE